MYVLHQPSAFSLEEDFIYPCSLGVDPVMVTTHKDGPYKNMEEFINAAQSERINVGIGRAGSSLHLAAAVLKNQTNAQYTIIPYGGGGNARVALIQKEVDVIIVPAGGTYSYIDQVNHIGIFQNEVMAPKITQEAPPINDEIGTEVPELASYRNWCVHRKFKEEYPDRYKFLTDKMEEAFHDPRFHQNLKDRGEGVDLYDTYRGEEETMGILSNLIRFGREFRDELDV